jgi:hypothetical protein
MIQEAAYQSMLAKLFLLLCVPKYKLEGFLCICGLTWAWEIWYKTPNESSRMQMGSYPTTLKFEIFSSSYGTNSHETSL